MKTPVNPLLQWLNMFLVAVHYPELMDGRYMLTVVLIQSTKVWQKPLRTYAPVVIQERYSFPIAMFYLAYMPQSLSAGLIRSDTLNGTQF